MRRTSVVHYRAIELGILHMTALVYYLWSFFICVVLDTYLARCLTGCISFYTVTGYIEREQYPIYRHYLIFTNLWSFLLVQYAVLHFVYNLKFIYLCHTTYEKKGLFFCIGIVQNKISTSIVIYKYLSNN